MKFVTRFFLLCLPTVLVGCAHIPYQSVIQNRDKQYLSAKNLPPTRIPPGVVSNGFENYYPIPDRSYPNNAKNVNLIPPGLYDK